MQDILDVIVSRRSIKKFKPQMVEKEKIEKILKAGMYAPSGMNKQSPIILAVTNKDVRDKLSKLCASLRNDPTFDPFYGAPVVLTVLADKSVFTNVYDGSCVMENMLLEAHSLGLGACWIHRAKEMFETKEGKQILKDAGVVGDFEGIGNCVVGYPDMQIVNDLKRKDNYVYFIE